jgi:hypothetical protein
MKNRFVRATEFKAKCLAILDEINKEGGRVTVTKRVGRLQFSDLRKSAPGNHHWVLGPESQK